MRWHWHWLWTVALALALAVASRTSPPAPATHWNTSRFPAVAGLERKEIWNGWAETRYVLLHADALGWLD